MKLTKDEKSTLKFLKVLARDYDVNVFQIDEVVTIAWARNFPTAKMITVSTSYFDFDNEEDRFRRTTGEYYALSRFFDMECREVMQIPLGEYDDTVIENILADMFVV